MAGFPLDRSALHIAIDMQRLFAERTEWFMPWLDRVLPNVVAIAGRAPERPVPSTRRFTPLSPIRLAPALRRKGIGTLIVTGGETDVCVVSTVMAAVDLGFRVVLPVDALCSARDETHDALMTLYRERFTNQVETTSTERVLCDWTI
jgi:nicotinamidase-related amidase